jgi:exopolysaccharide biosynthesis polyprenyl glycosylphosphotransferase
LTSLLKADLLGNRFIEKLFVLFCDCAALFGAFWLVFWLRYKSGIFPNLFDADLLFEPFIAPSLIMAGFWLVFYFFNGLYRDWFSESRLDEIFIVARTIIFGIAIVFVMVSGEEIIGFVKTGNFKPIFTQSRVSLILSYGITLLLTATFARLLMHSFYQYLYRNGIANQNLAVIGANQSGLGIIKEISNHKNLGSRIVGFIDNKSTEKNYGDYEILGKIEDISDIVKEKKITGIIVSHLTNSAKEISHFLNFCCNENLTIYMVPSLMDVISGQLKTQQICGIPLIVLLEDHLPSWQAQIKRLFDICVSLFILVPFMPFWIIVAIIIRFTDKGPAVYSQERIGKNGRPFIMYKFRSMYVDAEKRSGPQWATENDPRITPFGRFMRKSRIDEIPQLWNVLKGEMSIVGPRPERQYFIEKLSKEIPWYVKRLKMKPGITGWAQVKHKYDETIEDVKFKVMYDLYYFENMSIILDLKIIIQTILVVFTGKGAK